MVQDVSIYYGGMGPTTVSAAKTCEAIISRSEFMACLCWLSFRMFSDLSF